MKMRNIYVFIVFCIVLVFGCTPLNDVFNGNKSRDNGKVTLKISVTDKESATRTVYPDPLTLGEIDSFVLLGKTGGSYAELKQFANLTGATVDVTPDTWSFMLQAKKGGSIVLEGELTGITVTVSTVDPLNFIIKPLTVGNGDIDVKVILPPGHNLAGVETILDGVTVTPALNIVSDNIVFQKTAVPTGNYTLFFRLKDTNGGLIATISELVRVLPNLISKKDISVSASSFNSKPLAPTALNGILSSDAKTVYLTWDRNSNNETHFLLYWNDGTNSDTINVTGGSVTHDFVSATHQCGKNFNFTLKAVNTFGESSAAIASLNILENFTVTFDKQDGTGGSNSVSATFGSAMPSATAPIRAGFTFDGYWDTAVTGGVQYYNADMSSAENWDRAEGTTLYARWIPSAPTIGNVTSGNVYGTDQSFTLSAVGSPSIYYSMTSNIGSAPADPADPTNASTFYTTNVDLTASTEQTVYYKIKAITYDGSNPIATGGVWSIVIDKESPAAGSSGNLTFSGITNTSITVNWTKGTDTVTAQSNVQYLVYYSTNNNITNVTDCETNGTPFGTYTTDINTKNVTGLTTGIIYYFNVIVRDQSGNKSAYTSKASMTNFSFINKTWANTITNTDVYCDLKSVYYDGVNTIIIATAGVGIQISTDNGTTWVNKTTVNGLGHNTVYGVYAAGSNIYAATLSGLSISTNSGTTWVNKTTTNGLGSTTVNGVYASGSTIYAATGGGLSISTDNGATWVNMTTSNGLGSNTIRGVYASGSTIYAATGGGLSISTDNGITWVNKTTTDGLGSNTVTGVYASGSTIYAATTGGLSISTDNGTTWVNKIASNGLGSTTVNGVYASGSTIYAATAGGLSISTDSGTTWANKTTANGLGSSSVNGVYASGSTIYAATAGGLSISTDSGTTWVNKTTSNGLGSNNVYGFYVSGSTIYAATGGGLSISTDSGTTWVNKTTTNGLGNNYVYGVYAAGSTIYAATNGGGLSISTDNGATWVNKTTAANGLGSNVIHGVSMHPVLLFMRQPAGDYRSLSTTVLHL